MTSEFVAMTYSIWNIYSDLPYHQFVTNFIAAQLMIANFAYQVPYFSTCSTATSEYSPSCIAQEIPLILTNVCMFITR